MSDASAAAVVALNDRFLRDYPREAALAAERLPPDEVAAVLVAQPAWVLARLWSQLVPDTAERLLSRLPEALAAAVLQTLDAGRSAALLRRMDADVRAHYLRQLPQADAAELERMLHYPADSAGGMMRARAATLRGDMRADEALQRLRAERPRALRSIFLLDRENRLQAVVDIQDLALADDACTLDALARPVAAVVDALEPRDAVLARLQDQHIETLPVVDVEGRLLGVIHSGDLVRAIQDDASSDLQAMVGVSREERALSPPLFSVRKRVLWMHINLVTAFVAASIVGLFEGTIAQFTALAVLMPVVAGMAGNAGQQALAVTMRGLVLREIGTREWLRMAWKELRVGIVNGVILASVTATGVWLWSDSGGLALVIALAMVASMLIACVAGAMVPITLTRLRQDPALSSSIFLTTVTDVFGFLSFLGIATLLSGLLVAG